MGSDENISPPPKKIRKKKVASGQHTAENTTSKKDILSARLLSELMHHLL